MHNENLHYWHATLASIGDAVIATDPVGRITFINPVAERLTGWTATDAVGKALPDVFRIVNETTREPVENPALRALATGRIVGLANHTILIAKDGTEWPIDDSASPIRGDDGSVRGAVLVFRDITERKQAEVAQARLAAIVESSDDAIVGKSLDGIVEYWNRGAEAVFGYTAADMIGQSITRLIPRERLDEERVILDRIRRGQRVDHFETVRVRKDGTRIDVAITVSPICDAHGTVIGASKIARDVTTTKRAERAVTAALQAGEVGTYFWDVTSDQVTGDRNFIRLFGVLTDEHSSAPVADFVARIHPDDRDRVETEIRRTLETDLPFRSEYRIASPLGERWLLARGAVERIDGVPRGWAGVVADITDRKRAEAALAASRARLDYSVRASGIGFWYCDLPFDVLEWDTRVKEHFWLPPDARVTIALFYERLHPDDREPTRLAIESSIATRCGYDVYYRTVNPETKSEKWIRALGGSDYDAAGKPIRFDGVTLDVSDRMRTEAMLRSSEERFRIVSKATNDAIWDWDMRTNRVWWNEGVTTLFGHAIDSVGGDATWWYEMIHPADRDRVVNGIHAVIDNGGSNWSDEYRFRKGDGSYANVLDRGFAIHEQGKTVRLVGAMQDVTHQRLAESQLRTSEERFRSLFESMDEGYCVIEPVFDESGRAVDYKYLLANPALEKQTGLSDIVGHTSRTFVPNNSPERIAGFARVAETGETMRRTDFVPDLGRWFEVSAFRIGLPASRQVGVLFNDITQRKRAEAQLREKDERLKLLVDHTRDYGVLVTDHEGRVVEWAGGAEGITGFAPPDVLGHSVAMLFTKDDRAAGVPAREMSTAMTDGRAEDKRWHIRKDGTEFFADGVMVPLRGDDGTLRGFGKVFRDVTARKRAEEAVQFLADASASLAELVDYQSTLSRIANLAVSGFADWCVVDMIGEDGHWNRLAVTASETTAISDARTADGGAVPHVHLSGEPEVVPDLTHIDPESRHDPERLTRLRELGIRSYLCVPLISRERIIGGITFLGTTSRRHFGMDELRVAQNLAERVTVAIENAQLYRTLQEQDRRKDEFLATLAHELRNPLAPIRNGLQILRLGGTTGETADRALAMMHRQLGHITHLVDDLMDMARVSSGKVVLRREHVPLQVVIDAAVETSRQAIEAAGHTLTVRIPADLLMLDADRTRMVQVLANLLNNAAKYTPQGGDITLAATSDAGHVSISVTDTGIGIPSDMLPRVFDMFAQVGTSLERSQGGLGIGLTLVKRLVEMHNGTVMAESSGTGEGSRFIVRLPLAVEEKVVKPTETAPLSKAAEHPLDILVVDDNHDAAESLAMLLKLLGHTVRTAHDAADAFRTLTSYRPQLILLDLGLPGMSGYEAARHIRANTDMAGVTLAALTGWGQEEDRRRTRESGFDYHLTKPADPKELDAILRVVQNQKRDH